MKAKMVSVLMVMIGLTLAGCVTTGEGGTSHKVWTYNFQQSLARSGGDIAMTMVLDQGVNKADAVGLVQAIVTFLEKSDTTKAQFEAFLAELTKDKPQYAAFVTKIDKVVPFTVGLADKIPANVKEDLLSFLKDGALYGATMYKDGMKLKMVEANENLKTE